MDKLSLKQKRFCEYYVQTGNATESAKRSGYSQKTAYRTGADNLKKPQICAYIQEISKADDEKRIADAKEIMEYFTAVMRGEVNDQFGLDAPLQERTKAAVELAKRVIDTKSGGDENLKKLDEILKGLKENAANEKAE